MNAKRVGIGDGGCVAWYPEGKEDDDAELLVWIAPADGRWAVYVERLSGERQTGLASAKTATARATQMLEADGWTVVA